MIGQPVTDAELDVLEDAARRLVDAVRAKDYDTAYIIASTCEDPGLLAMFTAEVK